MTQRFALLAPIAFLLGGCPTTVTCGDDETFDGTNCVPFDGGNGDAGSDGAMEDPDVPCGGGCTTGVCDTTTNECLPCLGDDASSCTGVGENACVRNRCVACESHDDCTSLAAPECSGSNECVPCTGSGACEDRIGTTVCGAGACVECVSNADCTATNEACDPETNACETYVPRSGVTCGPCIADEQCMLGQVCAPTEFPVGSGTEVGNFCLWDINTTTPGPMGDCLDTPPYRRSDPVTTVDGATATVCTPQVSTCPALANYAGPPCTMRGAADAACGIADLDDGFCPATGSALCTVECTNFRDCPCTGAACGRQYACTSNRCDLTASCDSVTGVCG